MADINWSSNLKSEAITIDINIKKTYQSIIGWGGAFTEAAASVYQKLTPNLQKQVMNAYFGPEGLNYTLCRTHMNSCDFSLGNYNCDNTTNDFELRDFNIEHDKKYILPLIKTALGYKPSLKFFFTPWSPPAWMKGNGQMDRTSIPGLIDRDDIKKSWAMFFHKFIDMYKKEGVNFWGMTVQNEAEAADVPWESCYYSKEYMRDFIKKYLGPILSTYHPELKVMIWDHNRDHVFEWAKTIFGDPDASKYVHGIGFHWYYDGFYENVKATYDTYGKDKFLLATEACHCPGVILGDYGRGEAYGKDIIHDLNNGAGGWIDWNILLDATGGPNHLGNNCDAPIIGNYIQQQLHFQLMYYYLGQFTKFLPPGSKRVDINVTGAQSSLLTTSFLTPSNTVVLIVQNVGEQAATFTIRDSGHTASASVPAHAIKTFTYSKFADTTFSVLNVHS